MRNPHRTPVTAVDLVPFSKQQSPRRGRFAIERQHQTVIIGPANAVIMQRLWCHNMASVLCVHQAHQGPPNPSQGALVADKSCRHSPSVHACYCFLATVLGRHKRAFLKAFFPEFRTWLPTKPSVVRLFKYCYHLLRHRFFVTILSKVPKKHTLNKSFGVPDPT